MTLSSSFGNSDGRPAYGGNGQPVKVPQLQTIIPKRPRTDVITYTVQAGDNLSNIADRYDVDIDTLVWANGQLEEDPDYLVVGQTLLIPRSPACSTPCSQATRSTPSPRSSRATSAP